MKIKKVNRYSCDFCGKHKYSASHMKKHEKNCTKNPDRECACCRFVDAETKEISELIKLLPNTRDHTELDEHENIYFEKTLTDAANSALPKLRKETKGCPACIMATIRQAGIPVPMVTDFKYKEELESVTSEYWNQQISRENY